MDLRNLESFSKNFLKVPTKDSRLVPLTFNQYQRKLWHQIKLDRDNNSPSRIIVLKARQLGISTASAAHIYHQCVTNKFKRGVVIADDQANTNNLFNMCKRYYDFTPKWFQMMKRYSNDKSLVFENPSEVERTTNPGLMSSISVETANKLTAGRSGTIHDLLCSEFSFWKNASTVVSGLFQAVPLKPKTSIIIETTANGISGPGEEFYNRWKEAEKGGSGFTPLFFPWYESPEYSMEFAEDFDLDDCELYLTDRLTFITKQQLYWRRYKIKNEMGSARLKPVEQFKQEYPAFPEEAFISSGRSVFDIQQIMNDIEKCTEYETGEFQGGEFKIVSSGPVRVYRKRGDGAFAIGADVAEGLETGDDSAFCVMDKHYNIHALYGGHVAPDIYGRQLCMVGEYYNKAILAPEVNNHGHATLAAIKNADYYNIYTRETKEELSEDYTKKLGWQTNTKTKTHMLDEFVGLYRDGKLKIPDKALLIEMSTLSVGPDGDVSLNGKDLVVATCIAIQATKQAIDGGYKAFNEGTKKKFKTLQEKFDYHKKHEDGKGYYD